MVKEILRRDLDKHVFYGEFASRSCTESYYKDFVQRSRQGLLRRSCQQSSFRAFVQDFFHYYCQKPCSRDLVQRSCEDTSYAQRHCTGLCCTDFAKKSRTKILPVFGERLVANLPRSPLQRSWQEMAGISSKDLARRPLYRDFADILGTCGKSDILQSDIAWRFVAGILPRGLLHKFCQETSYRKFVQRSCQENSHKILHESFQEVSYRDLAYRILFEILYEDLARRSFAEISCRNLVQRAQFLFRSCLRECKVQGSIRFIRHAREQPVLGAGPWRELVTICDNF